MIDIYIYTHNMYICIYNYMIYRYTSDIHHDNHDTSSFNQDFLDVKIDAQLNLDRAMRRLLLLAIGAVDVNAAGVLGSGAELRHVESWPVQKSRGWNRTGIRTLDYTYHIGYWNIGWYWMILDMIADIADITPQNIQYHPISSNIIQKRAIPGTGPAAGALVIGSEDCQIFFPWPVLQKLFCPAMEAFFPWQINTYQHIKVMMW